MITDSLSKAEILDVFMLLDRIDVSVIWTRQASWKITAESSLSLLNHFALANYLLNGHELMLPLFSRKAVNYCPVSLTCITCKLFEHIICKHILAHLEDHTILTDLQHGFRSVRSCETQLVTTFQDLAQMHNKNGSQIVILDFSKAFDTVPHDGLLSKLKYYGIDEKI